MKNKKPSKEQIKKANGLTYTDFTILDNEIIRDTKKFGKNEILAYIAINYFADTHGSCFPSYEAIAGVMRASRTTAINAVQGLVEKGVIKLENRVKEDNKTSENATTQEKKKVLTSNLYSVVTRSERQDALKENRQYILKKKQEYGVRVKKAKATKLNNQVKNGKKNTSGSPQTDVSSNSHSKNLSNNVSIPQDDQESKVFSKENINKIVSPQEKMLRDSGIKGIPFKTDIETIESIDATILEQAIEITLSKATVPNWKYLLSTIETIKTGGNMNTAKGGATPTFKPNNSKAGYFQNGKNNYYGGRMRIGDKHLDEYDRDEFMEMFRKIQQQEMQQTLAKISAK